jgi:PTH1 family peptidyl-tRNA hydrolase
LIVGLGNPGRDYANTRHNAGFMLVDALGEKLAVSWRKSRAFECELARAKWPAGQSEVHLLKPSTYMNESGRSVAAFCRYHGMEPQEVLVIFDELNLPTGRTKLSVTGSAGGHNGLASLLQHFGADFKRLRIGVGPRHPPGIDLKDYVLGSFTPEQNKAFQESIPECLAGIDLLMEQGLAPAMNRLNRRSSPDDHSNPTKLQDDDDPRHARA